MPIYEYLCPMCERKFELMRPFSKFEEDAECPACRQSSRRVLSTFACFTKGSDGIASSVAGAGSSCSACGGGDCSTCH